MTDLLPFVRLGEAAPRWLLRALSVVERGNRHDLQNLHLLAESIDDRLPEDPDDHPWAEAPSVLMLRALAQIVAAHPGSDHRLAEPPPGARGPTVALRGAWVNQAAHDAFRVKANPDWAGPPPDNVLRHRCTLRVLLHDRVHATGVHAWLELTRIAHAGGGLRFVAAPASAVTPLGQRFQASLDTVTEWLVQLFHGAGATPPEAVFAWNLYLADSGRGLMALVGDSAAAVFAFGGLWVLGADLPAPWREPVTRLERGQLTDLAITASIDRDGSLHPVGHSNQKALCLQASSASAGKSIPVHMACRQLLPARAPAAAALDGRFHATMLDLVTGIAEEANSLDAPERKLRAALLDTEFAADAVTDAELDRLANRRARTAMQHALFGWARWARRGSGRLPHLFVRLSVHLSFITNARGPGESARGASRRALPDGPHSAGQTGEKSGTYASVQRLLDDSDLHHMPALLLHGPPGAGKTTVLRHHAQWLYRQAVLRLAAGQEPEEWPLYLSLAEMPEGEDDAAEWVRRHASGQFGAHDPLLDLLRPGATEAPGAPRLRLLLDGLNELKVKRPGDRHARAMRVLLQLRHAFSPDCTLLLSARTRHHFEIIETDDGMSITPVNLLPWGKDEVQQYIALRFADDPAYAAERFHQLWHNEQARELCAVPMQLAQQCDLWQGLKGSARVDALFTERANLYAAWLWLRLERGISRREGGHVRIPELVEDDLLLTDDDRDDIEARRWLGGGLQRLPQRGLLLPALFAQARNQWRAVHHGGSDDIPRGAVLVRASEAGTELLNHANGALLRRRWLAAVQDLGLVEISRTPDGDLFRFSHPSWGEFFASRGLLSPVPQDMEPIARNRLLRELASPALPYRDVQQLQQLRSQAAEAWSQAPALFTPEWLSGGLSIPLQEFRRWLSERPADVQAGYREFIRTLAEFSEDADSCRVDIRSWASGDRRMRPFGDNWQQDPLAWRELVMSVLWQPFREALLHRIEQSLGTATLRRMQQVDRLAPGQSDLDEALVLAVQALEDPVPWLQEFIAAGLLGAAAQCALAVRPRIEANPWSQPNPVLQTLRGLLLQRSVDAGPGVRERVQAAGVLHAIDRAAPPRYSALHGMWQTAAAAAFQGDGEDLRHRIDAGKWLGLLNDTLRFEPMPRGPGLRLRAEHWVAVGDGVADSIRLGRPPTMLDFDIGQEGSGEEGETPCRVRLPGFALASLAVTVAEWQAFMDAGGYADADAPHWRSAGAAAQRWLLSSQAKAVERGRTVAPQGWRTPGGHHSALPVRGITWFEAMAYAAWADRQCNDAENPWRLALPTEVHWEAGIRGPSASGPADGRRPGTLCWPHGGEFGTEGEAIAMRFNHIATRWGGPVPVGVFSPGYSEAGIADAAGNVWQWCANTFRPDYNPADGPWAAGPRPGPDDVTARRALRGGSFHDTAAGCRVAYRGHGRPIFDGNFVGMRLAYLWQPP